MNILNRKLVTLLFALVTLGLSACGDSSGNGNNTDLECQMRTDCDDGERCDTNGKCTSQPLSCEKDTECDFGDYCVSGSCVDATCDTDDACTDAVCVNDRCRTGCSDNEDCADGEACNMVTRICEATGCSTGSCPAYQRCDSALDAPTCQYTGDCNNDAVCAAYARQVDDGEDYICSTAQQKCIPKPPCGNDSDCAAVGEICEPRPTDNKNVCRSGCRVTSDCSLGQICSEEQGWRCIQGCDVDDDCSGENDVCVDLVCVETCQSRSECTAINPGYICHGSPRVCSICTDTSQCPANQFCDFTQGGNDEEATNPSKGLCVALPPTCPPDGYGDNHAQDRPYDVTALPFDPMDPDRPVFCAENTGGEWFKISASNNDVIEIELTYAGAGNLDLALRRPDGTQVATSQRPPSEDNGTELLRFGVDLASDFLVQVRGAILDQNLEYGLRINIAPQAACNDDMFEPNNDIANAVMLPKDVDHKGLEVCGGDSDFYTLQVDANQVSTITLAAPVALGNVDMTLYDSNSNIVAQANTQGDTEQIQYQNENAEDYVLEVRIAGGVGNVLYDLEWNSFDNVCTDVFETNDTCQDATVLGAGIFTDIAICSDPDFYAVDLLPLQTVTFRATYDPAVAAGDLDITLFGPNECATFIASETREPSNGGTTVTETITYQATTGGRFNLLGSLFAGINVPYTLEVDIQNGPPCIDDLNEPNEPVAISATDAAAGNDNVVTGQKICDADTDIFEIDLVDGQQIQWDVKFDNAQGDLDAFLLDPSGVVIASSVSSSSDTETVGYTVGTNEAGTYTLRVEGKNPARADYWVVTYVDGVGPADPDCPDDYENNDDRASAAPITSGTYGLLVCGGANTDDDWFTINLNPGEVLSIDVAYAFATGNVDLILEDASGTTVAQSRTNTDLESVTYQTATAQTMKWRVFTTGAVDFVPYTMTVGVGGAGPCVDDSNEPNDTAAQAVALSFPGLYPRMMKCDTDEDWFEVTLEAGKKFEAFTRYSTSKADLLLEIKDAGQTTVATGTEDADGATVTYTPTSGGTYFVRVSSAVPTRIEYDLMLFVDSDGDGILEGPEDRRCPDLYENNDNLNTAKSLPLGQTDDLLLCWESGNNDQDHYNIFVPAGATITVDVLFTHADGDINAKLYKGVQQVADGASTDDNETLTYTAGASGETIRLWVFGAQLGFTQYYSVDVQLTFADDCGLIDDALGSADQAAADTAGPTASGAYQDLFLCEGSQDWFRLPAGTTTVEAHIVTATLLGNIDLELVDATGTPVATSTNDGSTESIVFTGPAATYYIKVIPRGTDFFRNGYDLFIDANGDGGTTDPYCPDPYERNDDATTAYKLDFNANGQLMDTIACGADEDWFEVTLATRQYKWDVFFDHNAATADLALEVRDSAGNLVANASADSKTNDENLTFNAPSTGTYYLVVKNVAATPGEVPYFMQFRQNVATLCPEDAFEPNNTLGQAALLSVIPGTYALGSCSQGGNAEDYFKFTAANTGTLTITVLLDEVAMPGLVDIRNITDGTQSQLLPSTTSTNRFEYVKPVTAGDQIFVQFSNSQTGYQGYFMTIDN